MSGYYWIIIWIGVFAVLANMLNSKRTEIVCGQKVYRYTWGWAILAILPLLYLAAVRTNVGDTGAYEQAFREMPEVWGDFSSYINEITKDKGFYAFSAILKIILVKDVKIYFFILASIQAFLMIKIYRKYSTKYVLSIFLFLVSTDYISWMFNGVRQFLAVTITFAAFPFILKKKYIPAILMVLLAATVHNSALLVLPFIFMVQGRAWNKKTMSFIIVTIIIVAYIGQFTDILEELLQETQYETVVSNWQEWQDDGTNLLRVLVYSIPAILSLIGLRYIREADEPVINIATNMSIVTVGFYVVSMFTSGIYIGRLPIYFSLYSYILLPWEIENMFTKESARVIYLGMVAAYFVFYVYGMKMLGVS